MSQQTVRRVARQSAGLLAVQVALLVVQVGYTATTSRLFDPADFGAYAVAAATISLGTLVTVNGFAKAAARRTEETVAGDRQILGMALMSAALVALPIIGLAPILARIWAVPSAASLIRLMSLSLLAAAYAGVLSGVLRRNGRVRELSYFSLTAGLAGMAVGIGAALITRDPSSLAVMPVTTPAFLAALVAVAQRAQALPQRPTRSSIADLRYSVNSSGTAVFTYFVYTVPLWVLGRVAGAGTLGSWNRAVAVTQVPVESVIRSWSVAAFPHFRRAPGTAALKRAWTDLLSGGMWLILPISAALAPGVHAAVLLLLGDQWGVAAQMAVWLWMAACISAVGTLIITAAEAAGQFSVLWWGQGATLITMAGGVAGLVVTQEWRWLAGSFVAASVATLLTTVFTGQAHGLLDGPTAFRWLLRSLLAAAVVSAGPVLVAVSGADSAAVLACSAVATGLFAATSYLLRARLPMIDRFNSPDQETN